MRPFAYEAPRFTTSQQATPWAAARVCGWYVHFTGPPGRARSRAYSTFGYGVTRYIVLPTTRGAPAWPRVIPVEKLQACFSWATLPVWIWSRRLNRVLAKSRAG